MAKFKNLVLEQVRRGDVFSPFFRTVKSMEPEEVDYLENHESEPSSLNTKTPPAQIEWQWKGDRDLVYNCHLVKEIYDNSIYDSEVEDASKAKRYKLMGFVYNKNNNMKGIVDDYCAVSEEFSSSYDLDVLEDFISDNTFLYENDTSEMKEFTFSRPSDFDF